MTKKHFTAFADYIRIEQKIGTVTAEQAQQMRLMVISIARECNGRFDVDRFIDASTPDEVPTKHTAAAALDAALDAAQVAARKQQKVG